MGSDEDLTTATTIVVQEIVDFLTSAMKDHDMIVLPTKEGYDRWSEIYEEDGNPLIVLEEPHVERMLGNVTRLSILDVGCGTGRHSIRLAQRGGKVTGLDFSVNIGGAPQAAAGPVFEAASRRRQARDGPQ